MSTRRLLWITYLPALWVLTALALVSLGYRLDTSMVTRDVASIADVHPLAGFLSNLGVVLWSATVGVCWFAARQLRQDPLAVHRQYLRSAGLLTAYLLVDDLFQVHEDLAPHHLGISETVVYVLIGAAAGVHMLRFRRVILANSPMLFVSAGAFLAGSVVVDWPLQRWLWRLDHWVYFVEDGAKWLGIAGWLGYHAHVAHRLVALATPRSE